MLWYICSKHFTYPGLTRNDEMLLLNERKTAMYIEVHEDFERVCNKVDRISRKSRYHLLQEKKHVPNS